MAAEGLGETKRRMCVGVCVCLSECVLSGRVGRLRAPVHACMRACVRFIAQGNSREAVRRLRLGTAQKTTPLDQTAPAASLIHTSSIHEGAVREGGAWAFGRVAMRVGGVCDDEPRAVCDDEPRARNMARPLRYATAKFRTKWEWARQALKKRCQSRLDRWVGLR